MSCPPGLMADLHHSVALTNSNNTPAPLDGFEFVSGQYFLIITCEMCSNNMQIDIMFHPNTFPLISAVISQNKWFMSSESGQHCNAMFVVVAKQSVCDGSCLTSTPGLTSPSASVSEQPRAESGALILPWRCPQQIKFLAVISWHSQSCCRRSQATLCVSVNVSECEESVRECEVECERVSGSVRRMWECEWVWAWENVWEYE